jgi:hypothetical protein
MIELKARGQAAPPARRQVMPIGIPLLLAVFVVVCLIVLSTYAYVTAEADRRRAQAHARRQTAVQNAVNLAERACAALDTGAAMPKGTTWDAAAGEITVAVKTGHFLLSTLHTVGAANTINRIIDVFPANQQRQVAVQLSMVLNAVVSQQLVPTVDGTVVPVFEMMRVTPAIKNMIRENKIAQIGAAIQSGRESGGLTNDGGLFDLAKAGRITVETAVQYATDAQTMRRRLGIA